MTLPEAKAGRRERRLVLTWGIFYAFLWLYRSAASVAEQFVSQIVPLWDMEVYRSGGHFISWDIFVNLIDFSTARAVGTYFVFSLGTTFNWLFGGNPILINIGFQTVAFIGIIALLQAAKPVPRTRLAFLFLLPSFTFWSSIASKEALVVFFLCISSAGILRIWYGESRLKIFHVVAFAAIYALKPHYIPALAYLFGTSWAARYVRQPAALALILGLSSLSFLYITKDTVAQLVFKYIQPAFSGTGVTFNRPVFWETPADIFLKAPEGMFRSLLGPTFQEALSGHIFHFVSFVESAAILSVIIWFAVRGLVRMPAFTFVVGTFTTFWMLFPTYPFGAMNGGSAIRYRAGYIVVLFVLVAAILPRETYFTWRGGQQSSRSPRRAAIPARGTRHPAANS